MQHNGAKLVMSKHTTLSTLFNLINPVLEQNVLKIQKIERFDHICEKMFRDIYFLNYMLETDRCWILRLYSELAGLAMLMY